MRVHRDDDAALKQLHRADETLRTKRNKAHRTNQSTRKFLQHFIVLETPSSSLLPWLSRKRKGRSIDGEAKETDDTESFSKEEDDGKAKAKK